MASGKSTLGRLVAQRTGRTFVDLDQRIESRAGLPVNEIFARHGERAFRQWETEALEEVLSSGRPDVVALGGGALLVRASRLKALDRALVVTLAAEAEEISRRVAAGKCSHIRMPY